MKVLYSNGAQINLSEDKKTMILHFFATVPGPTNTEDVEMTDITQASIALDEEGIANLIIGLSQIIDPLKEIAENLKIRLSDED